MYVIFTNISGNELYVCAYHFILCYKKKKLRVAFICILNCVIFNNGTKYHIVAINLVIKFVSLFFLALITNILV